MGLCVLYRTVLYLNKTYNTTWKRRIEERETDKRKEEKRIEERKTDRKKEERSCGTCSRSPHVNTAGALDTATPKVHDG